MITEHHSQSPDETYAIGKTIGSRLKGDEIILLSGELGAGKTLITKGIAESLGIDPEEVVSPSFTVANYFHGRDDIRFQHIDLYRLGTEGGQYLPEIDDYIDEAIIVVEWAQYLNPSYFDSKRVIAIDFQLDPKNDNHRAITIEED